MIYSSFFCCMLALGMVLGGGRIASAADPNAPSGGQSSSPAEMLKKADTLRQEKSFRLARELYEKIAAMDIAAMDGQADPEIRTQARVWALDLLWREERGRGGAENMQQAEKGLSRLVEDLPDDSRWRAEAAESLGDLRTQTSRWDERHKPLEPWLKALKYWSQATDLETARPRYIAMNMKIAGNSFYPAVPIPDDPIIQRIAILPPPPPKDKPWEGDLATWCLRNVLRVSKDPAERTRALLMLGQRWQVNRIPEPLAKTVDVKKLQAQWEKEARDYLKAAVAEPANKMTGNAYWTLTQFYNNHGRYVEAKSTLDTYLRKYHKGEESNWEQASSLYQQITRPDAQLSVGNAFAPGSYIHASVNYRNISQATLRISRITPEAYIEINYRQTERYRYLPASREDLKGKVVREVKVDGIVNDGSTNRMPGNSILSRSSRGFTGLI